MQPNTKAVPATMRALELRDYDGGRESIAVVEKPVPRPGMNEVLVRVGASPVNPSDLMFLRGLYGVKKRLPIVPGFEAGGEVLTSGGGWMARWLVGRRVACAAPQNGDGTWAEYMVTPAKLCIPLRRNVTVEQGAAMIVNPFSAWALMDEARRARARAVVQTAAASALGGMINQLAARHRIAVVNIVRRPEQVELLQQSGAQYVLNSNDADFDVRLKELCRRLEATVAFDAVAGELTGQLLRAMPNGACAIVYGALSMKACEVDPRGLIFERKLLRGFWLSDWLMSQNALAKLLTSMRVQKLLASDLKTEIRARLPLEHAAQGLEQYATHMTGGKVLFIPSLRAPSD